MHERGLLALVSYIRPIPIVAVFSKVLISKAFAVSYPAELKTRDTINILVFCRRSYPWRQISSLLRGRPFHMLVDGYR